MSTNYTNYFNSLLFINNHHVIINKVTNTKSTGSIQMRTFTQITFSILLVFVITFVSANAQEDKSAKSVAADQICQLYSDYPMTANNLYKGKRLETTVKVEMVRKIDSLCDNAPRGTFTMEVVNNNGTVIKCVCNSPKYKSVLHNTPKGSHLNIQGTYSMMSSSFFEGNKQCKLTFRDCSFK